jgi:hypothetical protein
LLILALTSASKAIAATAKEPEEIWQELLKLPNDERQKRLVAGARADEKLVFQVGLVVTPQTHIVDKQHTRGLFLGDFFAIEEKGPRCLNKFPPGLMRAGG